MRALKRAFPKSIALQYANFMPGEWLPGEDKGYLRSVYAAAREIGVAVGGPDLLPYRKGQLAHAYPLILAAHGAVPTAIAVQDGNYEHRNPQSGAALSVADLFRFAQSKLQVDLIFWARRNPTTRATCSRSSLSGSRSYEESRSTAGHAVSAPDRSRSNT